MKIPLSLIHSFLPTSHTAREVANALCLLGLEVDAIHDVDHDSILEISLTPNLGHCMSALGIARELAAFFHEPLQIHVPTCTAPSPHPDAQIRVINSSPALCPRYLCCVIEQVTLSPSPAWLQTILVQTGHRPINWAVDALNYLMLKNGQPFHVFDYDRIEGGQLEICTLPHPEMLFCLDETMRTLPQGTLVIKDATRTLAAAGVIGSLASAVSSSTTRLLIEAAYFDPTSIRTTSQKLSFRSESSHRFEKGVDPHGLEAHFQEAIALLLQLSQGNVRSRIKSDCGASFPAKEITCRVSRINQILGTTLSQGEVEEIFQRLHFSYHEIEPALLAISVPFYRRDLLQEIDLIEEVGRIYGYNHIPRKTALVTLSPISHDPFYLFEETVRHSCIGLGLQELISSNLIGPKLLASVPQDATPVAVLHPKSEEHSLLRPSLLPGCLQVIKHNLDHQITTLRAFETGKIYQLQEQRIEETLSLAIVLMGDLVPPHWSRKGQDTDFFDLKGVVENFLHCFSLTLLQFPPSRHNTFHPGRQASIVLSQNTQIGCCGEIHPHCLAALGIKKRVLFAEINLHELYPLLPATTKMHALAQFPASTRDWTLSSSLPAQTLFHLLHNMAPALLEKIELIDLYRPAEGTPNLTFRCTYRDLKKTLSSEEADVAHAQLMRKTLESLANCSQNP